MIASIVDEGARRSGIVFLLRRKLMSDFVLMTTVSNIYSFLSVLCLQYIPVLPIRYSSMSVWCEKFTVESKAQLPMNNNQLQSAPTNTSYEL